MWKWKSKSHKTDEDALGPASSSGPAVAPASASAPPPAYGAATPQSSESGPFGLSAALGVDTCLAYLRLLTAFKRLMNETGYRNGLWEIWHSRFNTIAIIIVDTRTPTNSHKDYLRYGHGALLVTGMPWPVVNQAI
ncbi:hypothetical protein CTA1_3367 [Colletotrichum tanaceti]|uniref:Uncharacterized protein n=1 Tax=Colletotrichum tanaceti TaxID=1306861 RepID=A0A4U6X0R4_9PEZI|nr:hypothetical protein CTA1_3367 [Colletotrichum tanaceti]